jgi:hypothetical protein
VPCLQTSPHYLFANLLTSLSRTLSGPFINKTP